ncbi:MAG: methionyl-tRNA formyltransferase [Deltaproteobacteria bacterium]|nr:methionyl-tRNA formyltransferase [Deltaproteobacteria bacterium]
MKIVFWGKGNRGLACLRALAEEGRRIEMVVGQPPKPGQWFGSVADAAKDLGLSTMTPADPNSPQVQAALREVGADLFVLAGYGHILKQPVLDIPTIMTINLHGGKLPQYRGSSPMNWALINGETSFGLSIIKVEAGVDTGDVLLERTFDIGPDQTIRDLHRIADQNFPQMLCQAVSQIERGDYQLSPQDQAQAAYYPLRFPDDGLILWDLLTAEQVHNRVRALTEPYPCAFGFFEGRQFKIISSKLARTRFFGEPGRVYLKTDQGLLVCAQDRCLWISQARFVDNGQPLFEAVNRYDRLATCQGLVLAGQTAGRRT